ncbi:MAG: GNAT family N-acetyltransferase [Myxococcota bacterium]|nr:GNAT family N-acetyltransferase [Myxococcota bacterium]
MDGALRPAAAPRLRTARLRLRSWRPEDRAPFAAMNADPRVMRFMPRRLDRAASDRLADRIEEGFARRGFGLWAVAVPGETAFAGFVGLTVPGPRLPFSPCVEIGWRLAAELQGRGYATEAAREVLRFAFEEAGLSDVVSFTAAANAPSRRVMEKLGMRRDPAEDFLHPGLDADDPLRPHVLYRLPRAHWRREPV